MNLLREYIRGLLVEKNVLATGMCFPFAYQKAEEWFGDHFTKAKPGRGPKRHPDLNDKSKFKVVHGTVTDKWKSPPKPVVHGWVEMGDLVFDDQTKITKPNGIDKEFYYDMYQPEVYKEFTAEEAILNCAMKGGEGPWDDDLLAQVQQRDEWLQEKVQRGEGKSKRTLYHINKRPATPQPKMKYMQQWDSDIIDREGEKGDFVDIPDTDNWQRHWLDNPVKSGVFLTPNPADIAMKHGRSGNVYAYKVPEWVIDKSGGLHRYDSGSEVLIPEDVWNEAGDEIEFLGKSMDQKQLWDKTDQSIYGRGRTRKPKNPSWVSDEELKKWEANKGAFNIRALRATKHPESAIKMLKPAEVKKALAAFEEEYGEKPDEIIPPAPGDRKGIKIPHFGHKPSLQDQELIDMLKKRQNESLVREYVRVRLIIEGAKQPEDLPDDVYVRIRDASTSVEVFYSGKDGEQIRNMSNRRGHGDDVYGYVNIVDPNFAREAPCLGAWQVIGANALHGWGPLLYDVAMEYVGDAGLMADRGSLSKDAYNVWQTYMSRGDVQKKQLDDTGNTLTPDDTDNCEIDTALQHAGFTSAELFSDEWSDEDTALLLKDSPVMKVYTKGQTTIQTLKSLGRLIRE